MMPLPAMALHPQKKLAYGKKLVARLIVERIWVFLNFLVVCGVVTYRGIFGGYRDGRTLSRKEFLPTKIFREKSSNPENGGKTPMYTMSRVKRFINKVAKNEMFTTRQLLAFGERNAVDQATCTLVKQGIIIRITYGVFVIANSDLSKITPEAVAQVKAKAFKRQIVEHASDVGHRLGIGRGGLPVLGAVFATCARSSSFKYIPLGVRIYFKSVSARKFQLAGSFLGDILRSLWNLTKHKFTLEAFSVATLMMKRSDRARLPEFADMIPEWLHARFGFGWR